MMNKEETRNGNDKLIYWLFVTTTVIGLYLTTWVNYLLFHSLVELFSIIVAATVFIITWNSVKYIKNPYLIIVGISYLFIGVLDLLHTLTYKGMPIFTDYDYYANQLWIASRTMESCTLLAAFLFITAKRNIKAGLVFVFYAVATTLLIASIFYWKIFPVCFIAGKGLTPFKVYSEYAICTILVACIILLIRNRSLFADQVYKFLLLSMVFTIISELSFTFYIDNYGISNLIGHYSKLFSFMMIYRAIVATGIEEPYQLIFRELNLTNETLRKEIDSRIQIEMKLEAEIYRCNQVQMALSESEFFFKESQRAASIGSYHTDFIADRWESSEIMDKIFGIDVNYTRSVQGWLDIVHPDDRDKMDRYLREEVIAKGKLFSNEYRIIRINDGATRWVHGLGEVTFDSNGAPVSLTGTIQDITERKQTELELARTSRLLSEGQKIAHLGSWEYIAETGETIWSDEEFRIYGLEPGPKSPTYEELLAKHIHPDDVASLQATFGQALQSGSVYEMDLRIVRPDGSVRLLYNRAEPHFNETGMLVSFIGTALDITEQRQAEETLRALNTELSQFNSVAVGRELRMVELKRELNELCTKAGLPQRYELNFTEDQQ
jgi:PAS domain S-box-containing protein